MSTRDKIEALDPAHVHQCEYLEYREAFIQLFYPGDEEAQRWGMWSADGLVIHQVVMFCPYCGHDFRRDLKWQISGKPGKNELLRKAREAAEMYDILAAPNHDPELQAVYDASVLALSGRGRYGTLGGE